MKIPVLLSHEQLGDVIAAVKKQRDFLDDQRTEGGPEDGVDLWYKSLQEAHTALELAEEAFYQVKNEIIETESGLEIKHITTASFNTTNIKAAQDRISKLGHGKGPNRFN